jgi:hypothetical protein
MLRTLLACAVVTLVAATAGCRMCAHPYDYCGPTFTGEGCQECTSDARAGSILSPGPVVTSDGEMGHEMVAPTPDAEMVDTGRGTRQSVQTATAVRP